MRSLSLALLFILVFVPAAFARASDPSWLVEIHTKLIDGTKIHGAGYIVQIGNEFFVRTASHVTLGTENVQMISGTKLLRVLPRKGVIDNANDDQLIQIENPGIEALGVYSPEAKNFVVPAHLYNDLLKNKRRQNLEQDFYASFYIVPSWSKKRASGLTKQSLKLPGAQTSLFNEVKTSFDGTVTSVVGIIPGESGSPIFRTLPLGYNIKDLNGKLIDTDIRNASGFAAVILGHAQSYLRFFSQSSFSSPQQANAIVNAYLGGSRNSINEVQWKMRDGVTYRQVVDPSGLIQEANFLQKKQTAGDGTSGDGGDGTSGDGGGTGQRALPQIESGMIYNNQPTIAFKVSDETQNGSAISYTLYANWDNYRYLRSRIAVSGSTLKFKPIPTSYGIDRLITDKIDQFYENRTFTPRELTTSCTIDRASLSNGILRLVIDTLEPVIVNLKDPSFSLIQKTKSERTGEEMTFDIYGLFSIDMSDTSEDFETYSKRTFIVIGSTSSKPAKLECVATY